MPWCSSMISRATDNPKPAPSPTFLVVKKGSNTFSRCSALIPLPLSSISTCTRGMPSPGQRTSQSSRRTTPSWVAETDCTALIIKLINTCCSLL
ncbi:Uncharacterised protein [Vibrio cholerae]|nr:Uncharacterised protein [Vibrio cholerae]